MRRRGSISIPIDKSALIVLLLIVGLILFGGLMLAHNMGGILGSDAQQSSGFISDLLQGLGVS